MYSLHITDIAEEDILSAVRYIANVLKAPAAANNLLDEIEKHEKILENTPKNDISHSYDACSTV